MKLWQDEDERLGPAKLPWSQIPAPERSERGFWVALGVVWFLWALLFVGLIRLFWTGA